MGEAERTTAVEGLAFTATDKASPVAEKMASAFERVHHSTERASEKVKEFAHHTAMGALGAVGLGFGLHELADKTKEANLELEGAAKKISGVHFAFGGWRSDISAAERWTYSLAEGRDIVDKLEESEGKLKMTRGELGGIYKSAYAIGTRHNLNQKQMLDLTEKLGAAEKVLGTSAEMASMSISRAVMTGNIRGMDDFNKQLRFSVGNMKDFHKMSESARFTKIQRAMGDLMPAAEGMGKGFSGAMFDIREAVEDVTRDLTGPVFGEVSQSLQSWAKDITKVREDGKSIAAEYGEKLVSAFATLKKATSFLLDHWKEIAVIWGSMKFATWAKGPGGAGVGEFLSSLSRVGPGAARAETSLMGMAGKAGMVTEALSLLYIGAQGLAKVLDESQTAAMARHAAAPRAMTALTAGAKAMSSAMHEDSVKTTMGHLQTAFAAYGLKPGQMLSRETLAAELKAMEPGIAAAQLGMYGIKGMSARSVQAPGVLDEAAGRVSALLNNFAAQLLAANPDLGKGPSPHVTKQERNTYINHVSLTQEFKEADPDRVFHKAVNEIDHMVNAPRGATTNALGA